jgi:hypothetical protein
VAEQLVLLLRVPEAEDAEGLSVFGLVAYVEASVFVRGAYLVEKLGLNLLDRFGVCEVFESALEGHDFPVEESRRAPSCPLQAWAWHRYR